MSGYVSLIDTEFKQMVPHLNAVGIPEIPLVEQAGGFISVAVAIANAGEVDVGVRAGRAIRGRDTERCI